MLKNEWPDRPTGRMPEEIWELCTSCWNAEADLRPKMSDIVMELTSDVESDDYSESARSYELGKASDFACARPRPDFSAFLCLWRKVTIG